MGKDKLPDKAKLFIGILHKDTDISRFIELLTGRYGRISLETTSTPFTSSDYYKREMGNTIFRKFIAFTKLIEQDELISIKNYTNSIEKEYSEDGKRIINLDPGYILQSRIILASSKDFSHRIYLGNGIYGELTLLYRNNSFEILPWTYPDYRTEKYHSFFHKVRAEYRKQIV